VRLPQDVRDIDAYMLGDRRRTSLHIIGSYPVGMSMPRCEDAVPVEEQSIYFAVVGSRQ
jgi:hypothetical protein